MGLRRAKFRRLKFVREQVLMTATAQNIKRMVKLVSRKGPHRGSSCSKTSMILKAIQDVDNTWLSLNGFFCRYSNIIYDNNEAKASDPVE